MAVSMLCGSQKDPWLAMWPVALSRTHGYQHGLKLSGGPLALSGACGSVGSVAVSMA